MKKAQEGEERAVSEGLDEEDSTSEGRALSELEARAEVDRRRGLALAGGLDAEEKKKA